MQEETPCVILRRRSPQRVRKCWKEMRFRRNTHTTQRKQSALKGTTNATMAKTVIAKGSTCDPVGSTEVSSTTPARAKMPHCANCARKLSMECSCGRTQLI